MHVNEVSMSRSLPLDQRAFQCTSSGEALLDIYEFDANDTVGLIWQGRVDLGLFLGAAAVLARDVHAALAPSTPLPPCNVTYEANDMLERFTWLPGDSRPLPHRTFLREHGHAITYVHCDSMGEYPYTLWAHVHAPLPGLVGYSAPVAPDSLYQFMQRTGASAGRFESDLRTLVAQHMEGMRNRAR